MVQGPSFDDLKRFTGTVTQQLYWDKLDVDESITNFKTGSDQWRECPPGKFVWSLMREPSNSGMNSLGLIKAGRCA